MDNKTLTLSEQLFPYLLVISKELKISGKYLFIGIGA